MKRDYKLSTLVLIRLIMAVIIAIVGGLIGVAQFGNIDAWLEAGNADNVSFMNIIEGILSFIITFVFEFIIARGLLVNRMGSVGEYFDEVNHIYLKAILLSLVLSIIPFVAVMAFALVIVAQISTAMVMGGGGLAGSTYVLFILLALAAMVYFLFIAYQYYVMAEHDKAYSFGDLFVDTFRTGKDLIKETLVTYLKYYILPYIVWFILLFFFIGVLGDSLVGLILMFILIIAGVVYGLFAQALVDGELSRHYLNYKDKNPNLFNRGKNLAEEEIKTTTTITADPAKPGTSDSDIESYTTASETKEVIVDRDNDDLDKGESTTTTYE